MSEPVKIEVNRENSQDGHEYETHWHCLPPADEVPFTVTDEEWNADGTVRSIYEIRILP